MHRANPCLTCGACCAFFRVSFYWGEADEAQGGTVPPDLVEEVDSFRSCMKGTNQKHPRCIALHGEIGQEVRCTIYDRRATTCREFGVTWDRGHIVFSAEDLERCTRARAAWGLPPLFGPAEDQPPTNTGNTPENGPQSIAS